MRYGPDELQSRLSKLPPGAAERLKRLMSDEAFEGVIGAADAQYLAQEMGITVAELARELVPFAGLHAVAPISNFKVGAVALGLGKALYFGANLEILGQALSFTLHAEQAAVSNAWLNGERGLAAIAVSAAPCGYCRQFLYELTTAPSLRIHLPSGEAQSLASLLPDAFRPEEGGLMREEDHGLRLSTTPDDIAQAALAAANASYSPYTSTFAGVALKMKDGQILSGRYAENIAFNPSLSPLEAALSSIVFKGYVFADIQEAVLVELPNAASQAGATETVLKSVAGTVSLRVLKALKGDAKAL